METESASECSLYHVMRRKDYREGTRRAIGAMLSALRLVGNTNLADV